jgi:hypothetical protein
LFLDLLESAGRRGRAEFFSSLLESGITRTAPPAAEPAVTRRSLLISLALVALMAAVQPWNDLFYGNTFIQGNHFPIGAVFILTLLVALINPVLRIFGRSAALSRAELLAIWCIVVVGMSVPGSALLRYLFQICAAVPDVIAAHALWPETVLPYLPDWMFVSTDASSHLVHGFRYGAGGLVPWRAWLRPALVWGLFSALTMWAMFCLTTIFRKQWVEHERLSFPLVQLPLELCRTSGPGGFPPLFRHRAFWIGVAIPVLVHGPNGLCRLLGRDTLFPLPFLTDLNPYIGHIPGAGGVVLRIYLSVIAIGFLLTLRTAFSFWFFYVFFMAERIIAAHAGVNISGYDPFSSNQITGAYIVLFAVLLYRARRHLAHVLAMALRFRRRAPGEFMSYPAAVFGLLLALLGMAAWSTVAAAAGFLWALLFCFAWVVILVVCTRVVAQAGILHLHAPAAHMVFSDLGLSQLAAVRPWAVSAVQGRLLYDVREVMMPNAMNSARIAGETRLPARRLLWGMAVALLVAFLVASASQLKLAYTHGSINWADGWGARTFPRVVCGEITRRLHPPTPAPGRHFGFLLGLGLAGTLAFLRSHCYWWPLSPIGLLFAGLYPMKMMWFSFFLAWLMKWLVMRYGGGRGYRITRNLCLGVLMGDALMGGLWMSVGLALGRRIYVIMPG